MPKEKIVNGDMFVTVGWNKFVSEVTGKFLDNSVQIATVAPGEELIVDGITPDSNGWYVTLDEDGLDDLISLLHKVKRQTYGKKNVLTRLLGK